MFGGGFNVGVNVETNKIIYNDKLSQVVDMLEYFKANSLNGMLEQIDNIITKYQLTKENQEGYLQLRKAYNSFNPFGEYDNSIMLYVLICFAFNNQIRFNSKGKYNMPFGKNRSSFNPTLREKFIVFVERLHKNGIEFNCKDFVDFEIKKFTNNDLVYCDPPYFNSTATYNENGGWTQENENDLLHILNQLHSNGVKFALSNNLTTNPVLENWAIDNGYIIHYLNGSYSNCNYQKKDKRNKDVEVLIVNYEL